MVNIAGTKICDGVNATYSRGATLSLLKTKSEDAPPLKLPSIFFGAEISVTSSTVVFAKFATPPAFNTNAAGADAAVEALLKKSAPPTDPPPIPPPAPMPPPIPFEALLILSTFVAVHSILSKKPSAPKPTPLPPPPALNCKLSCNAPALAKNFV